MEVDRLAKTISATIDNVRSTNTRRRSSGGKVDCIRNRAMYPINFSCHRRDRCPEVKSVVYMRMFHGASSLIIIRYLRVMEMAKLEIEYARMVHARAKPKLRRYTRQTNQTRNKRLKAYL